MPTLEKFNKTYIERFVLPLQGSMKPGSQQYFWHPHVHGLGLKLTPDKAVFIVQGRVKDPVKGEKNTRKVIGGYRTMTIEDAEKKAQEMKQGMRDGIDPVAEAKVEELKVQTLRDALEAYINARKADQTGGLRPKTISVYRSALSRGVAEWLDRPVCEITPKMVIQRYQEMATTPGPRSKKDGAKAQASQTFRVLRSVLNYAHAISEDDDGNSLLPANPVRKLSATNRGWNKPARKEDDAIPKGKLKNWYRAVRQLQNATSQDYLLLCLFTGLRRNAAISMKWEQVNFADRTIFIPADIDKEGENRTLPMSDYVYSLLKGRERLVGNAHVFPGEKPGTHLAEPKSAIASVVKKCGVKFSSHTLRDTFASVCEYLDIGLYKQKRLLCQSTGGDVTMHHYITLDVDKLRESAQKVADFLVEHCGIKTTNVVALAASNHGVEAVND
jgi:integrase